jgi:hypothetical protein
MPHVLIAVIALLVGTLGVTTTVQLRRLQQKVDTIDARIRRSEQRRTEAGEEVRRLLADGDLPAGDKQRKRRRHLRTVPVYAGLAGATMGVIRWARNSPLATAAGAAVATVTVVVIFSIPSGRSDDAMPEPPGPRPVQLTETSGPSTPATSTTPAPSSLTGTVEPAPALELSTSSTTSTADQADRPPHVPSGPASEMTAETPPSSPDEPESPRQPLPCALRIHLLGVAIQVCSLERPVS